MKNLDITLGLIICLTGILPVSAFVSDTENKGVLTLDLTPDIVTASKGALEFQPMHVKVVKIEDKTEVTVLESDINEQKDINIPVPVGKYKLYVQLHGHRTVWELDNEGSDAHGDFSHATSVKENSDNAFGKVRTYVYTSTLSNNKILNALKNGHSIMTDGPLVIFIIENEQGDNVIIGDEITGCDFELSIMWKSTSEFGNVNSIRVYQGIVGEKDDDEEITEYHLSPNTLHGMKVFDNLGSKIPLSKTAYIRLEASTDMGNKAYTNPIWITMEGDWRDEWIGENSDGGSEVTTTEFREAIHHWLSDIPVREHIMSTPDLQEIIVAWLT